MGMTVTGATSSGIKIKAALAKIEDEVSEVLEEEALIIAMLASDFAPRKTGALEDSIGVKKVKKGEVGIGYNGGTSGGTPVEKYGPIMHRNLEPYGMLNKGPGSIAKGDGVGGGFFERAVFERAGVIASRVAAAARRAAKRLGVPVSKLKGSKR